MIKRMGQRILRMYPLQAESLQWQGVEERVGAPHRVNGSTDVVIESRLHQLQCPGSATNGFTGFIHLDRAALERQTDCRRKSVGACPDDQRIVCCPATHQIKVISWFIQRVRMMNLRSS